MQNASIYTIKINSNSVQRMAVQGSYFKILNASGALNVKTANVDLKDISVGMGLEGTPFDYLEITDISGASNDVRLVIAGEGFIDTGSVSVVGLVNIGSTKSPLTNSIFNSQKTVTSASGLLLSANPSRSYLLIQNNNATGNIFISFGDAATLSKGIKLSPGGNFEMSEIQSTQEIYALGDQASNANIVTVEGS